MERSEFEELHRLSGKIIEADIEFRPKRRLDPNILVLDEATVENAFDLAVCLTGSYDRRTGHLTLNFVLQGTGPICRVEVNGPIHPGAGRTHKHELQQPSDPRNNLPFAAERPDLAGKAPREVWELLCRQARIDHQGQFHDPSGPAQ